MARRTYGSAILGRPHVLRRAVVCLDATQQQPGQRGNDGSQSGNVFSGRYAAASLPDVNLDEDAESSTRSCRGAGEQRGTAGAVDEHGDARPAGCQTGKSRCFGVVYDLVGHQDVADACRDERFGFDYLLTADARSKTRREFLNCGWVQ